MKCNTVLPVLFIYTIFTFQISLITTSTVFVFIYFHRSPFSFSFYFDTLLQYRERYPSFSLTSSFVCKTLQTKGCAFRNIITKNIYIPDCIVLYYQPSFLPLSTRKLRRIDLLFSKKNTNPRDNLRSGVALPRKK